VGTGLIAMSGSALANHGKAGLWSTTVTIATDGYKMPDMSKMPPEVQARMRAMGVTMGGNTITAQHCMTPAEVGVDVPRVENQHNKDCKIINARTTGHSMSADMVCSGGFVSSGHMEYTYDSDMHYTAVINMTGTGSNGQPMHNHETVEGHWLSADCGGVTR
jgi:hypothetical protein